MCTVYFFCSFWPLLFPTDQPCDSGRKYWLKEWKHCQLLGGTEGTLVKIELNNFSSLQTVVPTAKRKFPNSTYKEVNILVAQKRLWIYILPVGQTVYPHNSRKCILFISVSSTQHSAEIYQVQNKCLWKERTNTPAITTK